MDTWLNDLVDRMLDKSDEGMVPYISSDTISWKAYREAEKMDNTAYIALLVDFVSKEKNKEKRGKAYFILGHIARNTKDAGAMRYLIGRVAEETDKYILSSLMDRISVLEKPAGTDLAPLIAATRSSTWQIRQSAVKALQHTNDPLAERRLLDIIEQQPADEYDLFYANIALSSAGTKASIPSLEKLLTHKKQDVSGTALGAILQLSDASCLPLFLAQLDKGKNKITALAGVIQYGDETVIPAVIKRVKELVSRKRTIETVGYGGKTELVIAMEFLLQYAAGNDEIMKLYDLLLFKKYDLLWDSEREWLQKMR